MVACFPWLPVFVWLLWGGLRWGQMPLLAENCDFESSVLKPYSCLEKDSTGSFNLKKNHQYYYQCQQQIFTVKQQYYDFVAFALGLMGKKHSCIKEFCQTLTTGQQWYQN